MTQWFDPEPTLKGAAFAQALQGLGHKVHVITGFPNYPGGKIYDGFRIRLLQRETCGDVVVWRVPLFPSHDSSKIGRIANYLSFMFAAVIAGLLAPRPDAIYAYHPPLTVGIAAAFVGWLRRAPVCYDIQDLWPDTLHATGMIRSDRLIGLVGWVSLWTYRRMTRIAVLSRGFRRTLHARGIPAHRLELIPNWAPAELDCLAPTPPQPHDGPVKVVFAGNMGRAQGLRSVLDAVKVANLEKPIVELLLVGGGIECEGLKDYVAANAIANIKFHPQVPSASIPSFLAEADVLLVHLLPDELFEITIPSKTQAYLAAGRPIVMGVSGDAADIVMEAGAGVLATPGNVASIAQALRELATASPEERSDMGRRGRRYYDRELSFRRGVMHFHAILMEMTERSQRRR